MSMNIRIEARSDQERARNALSGPIPFGEVLADLMVQIRHDAGRGWHDAAIVPFGPLALSPAAKVLHYSSEIFEGHKAYGWPGGEVALFRAADNARRLNQSARRMLLPEIPEDLQLEAIEQLVDLLREWVPREPRTSLYLRPTMIGLDGRLGVGPSREHLYFVIASPVGPYFKGHSIISIKVEEEQVRAVPGGVGSAKTGGNYAAGLQAQERARAAGFDQVLWLDARERRFIEELGAMNVFAVEDGALITPPLTGTILEGITRQSILEVAADHGVTARECPMPIDEVVAKIVSGRITEMFAAGTAAVITSIGTLSFRDQPFPIGDGTPGPVARTMHTAITDIQYGRTPDRHGWMRLVPHRGHAPMS